MALTNNSMDIDFLNKLTELINNAIKPLNLRLDSIDSHIANMNRNFETLRLDINKHEEKIVRLEERLTNEVENRKESIAVLDKRIANIEQMLNGFRKSIEDDLKEHRKIIEGLDKKVIKLMATLATVYAGLLIALKFIHF